jgi:hypothetical protein
MGQSAISEFVNQQLRTFGFGLPVGKRGESDIVAERSAQLMKIRA